MISEFSIVYPFRGDQDYAIPACKTPVTKAANPPSPVTSAKSKLAVFPNPVTGELTINWSSQYSGTASITILDAGGKEIRKMSIKKDQAIYTNCVEVKSL